MRRSLQSDCTGLASLLVGTAACLTMAGCAYGTPQAELPAAVPQFSAVDVDASEVVVHDDMANIGANEAVEARRDIAEILNRAQRTAAPAKPARFRANVTLGDVDVGWWGICVGIGVLVAAPVTCSIYYVAGGVTYTRRAHVELSFDAGGRTWTGVGDGEASGGLYVTARRRALAEAIQRAMAQATTAMQSSGARVQ